MSDVGYGLEHGLNANGMMLRLDNVHIQDDLVTQDCAASRKSACNRDAGQGQELRPDRKTWTAK